MSVYLPPGKCKGKKGKIQLMRLGKEIDQCLELFGDERKVFVLKRINVIVNF